MTRIAIADDDVYCRTHLRLLLEAEGYTIDDYLDGISALQGIERTLPDLAILDIKMPRMDGLEVVRHLRRNSKMPIILLTAIPGEDDEVLGFETGADDYIRKPYSGRLIVERVRAILRRLNPRDASPSTGRIIERGKLLLDPERHVCLWDGTRIALTVKEFLILYALAQRPGASKSRSALLEAAYEDRAHVNLGAVDKHVSRIRRKLKMVDDNFNAINTHYGAGYSLKILNERP